MSDDFDPYFKWLAIPPAEQPPNHYRLLGVPLFTSDADVINNAADQRMSHLRGFQSGLRGGDSQKILNELSAARRCLADPAKKAAYDSELEKHLAGQGCDVVDGIEPVDSTAETSALDDLDLSTSTPTPTRRPASDKTQRRLTPKQQRLTPKQQRLRSKLNVFGHIVSPLLGLALAVLIYYLVRGFWSENVADPHLASVSSNSAPSGSVAPNVEPPSQPTPTPSQSALPGGASSTAPSAPLPQPLIPIAPPSGQPALSTQSVAASTSPAPSPVPPSVSATSTTPSGPAVSPLEATQPPSPPAVALETSVQQWMDSAKQATTSSAHKTVAELGVQLVKQAISENRKELAQECAAPTLQAARRCGSQELVRQVTMLVLEIEKMEVKE